LAGLGPFRLLDYRGGEKLVLEANPHYWRRSPDGERLPRLDRITFLFVGSSDAEVIRFQAGEVDVISRLSAENFNALERRGSDRLRLVDVGPGLEYAFLFFNLNDLEPAEQPELAARQEWFRDRSFREAISRAIDRRAVVELAFQGRATPLWGHVPPGNHLWLNESLPRPDRSLAEARSLLREAGFRWDENGALRDRDGRSVEFSIVTNSDNDQRMQMATLLQHDLGELGITVRVAGLEFRALLDRLLSTFEYDACVLSLGGGDADPNPAMNVLMSDQPTHLWRLKRRGEPPRWQLEIDELMERQLVELDRDRRKRLYDRVQVLMAENKPLIGLASPSLLIGARRGLEHLQPSILEPHVLWNADELSWR
jgi:peptide/nickel transport system substrate-binding protein